MSFRSCSETWSLANRLYSERGRGYVAEQSEKLASLPNDEYDLHDMSCHVCRLLDVSELFGRTVLVQSLSRDCRFCGILRECHQHFARDCKYMGIYFRGSMNNLQICFREDPSESACEEVHIQLYSRESPMQQKIFRASKDLCETAGSEASIGVMKKWINHCSMTHQHAPPMYDCKPARLIKLAKDDDDSAQLYSPETPVQFAALSYRWGPGKQSETTRKNVSGRFKEMKTSGFPNTLRDAICVTRKLGLEYIWIDRLCIIQDDKEDWAKQASLMASIYASAHIVLSATATEDCEDGLLQKRVEPLVIKYTLRGSGIGEVRARQIESHACDRISPKSGYTLFQRGWCLQERLLARRIIHFMPDEILFECQAGRQCECGAANTEVINSSSFQGFHSFACLQTAPMIGGLDFGCRWLSIMWDYSNMELTYGKDSLPALSGVAASMEHLRPGKYIAGLWQHDIATQLGWYIDSSSSIRRWKYPEDVEILGPTFSWSSHVRSIEVRGQFVAQDICTLEDFDVDTATCNPFGQVRHASIRLSGRVVPGDQIRYTSISLSRELVRGGLVYGHPPVVSGNMSGRFAKYGDTYFDSSIHERSYDESLGKYNSDNWRNTIPWESMICFGLYECGFGAGESDEVDALLLQPNKTGTGEYVRIGVVRGLRKPWFDEFAVASTVTIV